MSKFVSLKPCPICNKPMMFKNNILDNYITLYECYSCSECKYEVGVEFGIKFEYGAHNDSMENSKARS